VYWSAVWVGTLAALAVALIIGLIGLAVGAQVLKAEPWVQLTKYNFWSMVFSVIGAFFAFVAGGWVAARIAGIRRSEPAMLHGAVVWALAVPFLVGFAALGAGSFFGGWYGGLSSRPAWAGAPTPAVKVETKANDEKAIKMRDDDAAVARNTALGALTALLLGLVGSVLGGWMASGEPMSFTHYRKRDLAPTGHRPF
jgi:uncharacterized membrane protein YeaQ/YmgE (transglycosylase-associated protein family)